MKTLDNYLVEHKNILMRVDLNVPVVNKVVTEKSRIEIIKNTINRLQKQKNKIFLISHFGRPQGKKNTIYSLKFLCPTLELEFGISRIFFAKSFDDIIIQEKLNEMKSSDICLFENIRFHPGEENNDLNFIKAICKNFDVFINDAFSVSHRNHASIVGPPKFLPSLAGSSLLEEIKNIDMFVNNRKKPNIAIIGGSKISTKIALLNNLLKFCDAIIIGGAMANTFLHAKNINVGQSLCEKDLSSVALSILGKAIKYDCEIILPVDVICSSSINDQSNINNYDVNNIPSKSMALDIGAKTIALIGQSILNSKMILWNGPLGAFEYAPFDKSSIQIANKIKDNAKNLNISTLAGGGDTVSVIKLAKAEKGFDYISKAGGAFLQWLEGKGSFGVNALKDNKIN
jgi:phosphoglycerate kinase